MLLNHPAAEPEPQQLLNQLLCEYERLIGSAGRLDLYGQFALLHEARSAAAAQIAGAATLLVADDAFAARAALHAGLCDFVVADLGEAVRILKNEVRRRAPVGVCLVAASDDLLAACAARGLQPDLLDRPHPELVRRGALLIAPEACLSTTPPPLEWGVNGACCGREATELMEALDGLARRVISQQAGSRVHWLTHAPRRLGRAYARLRVLPASAEEHAAFIRGLPAVAGAWRPAVWTRYAGKESGLA